MEKTDLYVIVCESKDGKPVGFWDGHEGSVESESTLLTVTRTLKEARESLGDVPRKYTASIKRIHLEAIDKPI